MSKRETTNDRPAPAPTPAPPATAVVPAPTADNVRAVVARHPDAISFDPADEANELLSLRCQTDPGIAAQQRDGWRGLVTGWYVGTWEIADETSGEVVTLPSLCLLTPRGELVRLCGWPAITSWANLVRAAGADRCRAGIPVVVKRRPSGTAGRSYWIVLPDAGN